MISLTYSILNSKNFQKETFIKEHQIFADNLMREKKNMKKIYQVQISINKSQKEKYLILLIN